MSSGSSHSVQWEPFSGPASRPLPEHILRGAELLLGVNLPSDYWQCVQIHHGCCPNPDCFRTESQGQPWYGSLGVLLSLDPYARENVFDAIHGLSLDDQLPRWVIPIAADGGGNYLCLDYRTEAGRANPKVVFWFHEVGGEEGIMPVAETFSGLLGILYTEPDQ